MFIVARALRESSGHRQVRDSLPHVHSPCSLFQCLGPVAINQSTGLKCCTALLIAATCTSGLCTRSGFAAQQDHRLCCESQLLTRLNVDLMRRSLDSKKLMEQLAEAMRCQRLSVSFEVVARCLSHHGQLPNSEYLVATAITRLCPDGRIEVCLTAPLMPCLAAL